MKRFFLLMLVVVGLAFGVAFSSGGPAEATMKYKKATGLSCSKCHDAGKSKKEPSDNPLYKKAVEHKKKGKPCMDCHQGQPKPKK